MTDCLLCLSLSHPIPLNAREGGRETKRQRLTFEGDRYVVDASAAGRHVWRLRVQHPLHVADAVAMDGLGAQSQGGGWVHLRNVVLIEKKGKKKGYRGIPR